MTYMKAKLIVHSRKPDFENAINEFLSKFFDIEIIDIKYSIAQSTIPGKHDIEEIDITYSALILYKEQT